MAMHSKCFSEYNFIPEEALYSCQGGAEQNSCQAPPRRAGCEPQGGFRFLTGISLGLLLHN